MPPSVVSLRAPRTRYYVGPSEELTGFCGEAGTSTVSLTHVTSGLYVHTGRYMPIDHYVKEYLKVACFMLCGAVLFCCCYSYFQTSGVKLRIYNCCEYLLLHEVFALKFMIFGFIKNWICLFPPC